MTDGQVDHEKYVTQRDQLRIESNKNLDVYREKQEQVHCLWPLAQYTVPHRCAALRGPTAPPRCHPNRTVLQVDQQIAEIDKLNSIINGIEREMLRLKRQYEMAVEQRNYTGTHWSQGCPPQT